MDTNDRPPDVRPVFRKLAIGVAVVCFILAIIFAVAAEGDRTASIICLAVGGIMAAIGATGTWPPRGWK